MAEFDPAAFARQTATELRGLLGLAVIGVLLAFLVVEGGLRLSGFPTGAGRSISAAYDIDREALGPFRAGSQVRDAWPPELAFDASFNSLGCRGAEPREVDAPVLLAMGDSMTFGLGVNDPDTWPAILDERLHDDGRARPMVNLSSAQLLMEDHLFYVERALPVLRPDVVMLMVPSYEWRHLPPGAETHHQEAFARERQRRTWPTRWIHSLAIYEARTFITLWRKRLDLLSRGQTLTPPDRGERPADTAGLRERIEPQFREFAARVEEAGAELLMLPFPKIQLEDGDASYAEPWTQALARELGIATVDLTGAFQAHPDPNGLLLLPFDLHASRLGNTLIAETVAEHLRRAAPR